MLSLLEGLEERKTWQISFLALFFDLCLSRLKISHIIKFSSLLRGLEKTQKIRFLGIGRLDIESQ